MTEKQTTFKPGSNQPPENGKPNILVIDDEPAMHQALAMSLGTKQYDIRFAANGAVGWRLLQEQTPDLIFLDLQMPVMDGLAFLDKAHLQPDDPYLVVVVSGYGDDQAMKQCYNCGVHFFLRKPISMIEVRCLAKRCIAIKRMEKQQQELIVQLRDAIATSRALKELLPICSSCRKIRDDQGYWHALEAYIQQNTDSDFTHGMCPDCASRLYPEFYPHHKTNKKTPGNNP